MRVGRPIPALPQPVCDYCGDQAVLARDGDADYPYRADHGRVWICVRCAAWIGVYTNSRRNVPLGRLANAELRQAKTDLHAALEPLVAAKMRRDGCNVFEARAKGLRWLGTELGLDPETCSLHGLDLDQCRRARQILDAFLAGRQAGEMSHGATLSA